MLLFAETDLLLLRNKPASKDKHTDFPLNAALIKTPSSSGPEIITSCIQNTTCQTHQKPHVIPEAPSVINITVLGEAGTGKSSLVQRLTQGAFSRSYLPNHVANTTLLRWGNKNGQPSYFRFLDTNDVILDPNVVVTVEDRAEALHGAMSDYVIFVYDITDHASFEAITGWLRLARDFLQRDARMILVGNKSDLTRKRQVHRTAGPTLAALNHMDFLETSALNEHNIHKLFLYIGRMW